MNLPDTSGTKMEYIQKLFMDVQHFMQQPFNMEGLISFLDAESPEFRSIAYESASMSLANADLKTTSLPGTWKQFYQLSVAKHSFHVDIGLGWAFAKNGIDPGPYFPSLPPVKTGMVYDGIGYYYALFNGRRTIKNQLLPGSFNLPVPGGFDQGVGRRLWYTSRGNAEKLKSYLDPFDPERKPALWRGIGIACGYVGGCDSNHLETLLDYSAACKDQLSLGIRLAVISRHASESITPGIELACKIICDQSVHSILMENAVIPSQPLPVT